MFSQACKYAIKASIFIASKSEVDERVSVRQIAEAIDSPVAYTAKIVQHLVRSNLIESVKGPRGGYEIPKTSRQTLTLKAIVLAVDGTKLLTACVLGLHDCNDDKPCPVHGQFKVVREKLNSLLHDNSICDLVHDLAKEEVVLKQ